jgi:D-alanyl-D-alanine dipeptidase
MKCAAAAMMLVTTLAVAACAPTPPLLVSEATTPEAAGLVDIRALVPDIDLDIRYAGSDNFVGTRVDGYGAARCYLLADAAKALQQAELDLRREGMRLRLYDCYRPARAVRHFVAWAGDLDDQRTRPEYYPRLDKRQLLGDYISPTSGHSRGATMDLTLMQCQADGTRCEPLDMGTPFDFFDTRANTDSTQVDARQRENRQRLLSAMERAGFRNYPMEWWHFTLDPEPAPKVFYDVPIE